VQERGKLADSSEELLQEGKAVEIKSGLQHIILAGVWCNVPPVSLTFSLRRYWENGDNEGYSMESFVILTFHMKMLMRLNYCEY
jgi:hypothetical protein